MLFTLEALQAHHGDCLILHYGDEANPRIIIIDGGPEGVYRKFLKPRLQAIKEKFHDNKPLPVEMLMVSHMDDDHVNGILDLTHDLTDAEDNNQTPLLNVAEAWFNTFDDIVGNTQVPVISALTPSASVASLVQKEGFFQTADHHVVAMLASTGQGRRLRDDADLLSITVNSQFSKLGPGKSKLVRREDAAGKVTDLAGGLKVTVLHPNHQRLVEMQEKWDKDLKKAHDSGDDSIIFASLTGRDTSPFNLASIVCLVELQGKRILLTGDARDDDILAGLRDAGLLDAQDQMHVDILKIPHHGSDRNMSSHFLEHVTADHYVISGNGEHHNPDKAMLVMLSMARKGNDDFTIHLTNHSGKHDLEEVLDEFIDDDRSRGRTYRVNFRDDTELSVKVDLLSPVAY